MATLPLSLEQTKQVLSSLIGQTFSQIKHVYGGILRLEIGKTLVVKEKVQNISESTPEIALTIYGDWEIIQNNQQVFLLKKMLNEQSDAYFRRIESCISQLENFGKIISIKITESTCTFYSSHLTFVLHKTKNEHGEYLFFSFAQARTINHITTTGMLHLYFDEKSGFFSKSETTFL